MLLLITTEPQVRSIADHVRPDRQSQLLVYYLVVATLWLTHSSMLSMFVIFLSMFVIIPSMFVLIPSMFVIIPSTFVIIPSMFVLIPSMFVIIPSMFVLIPFILS